MMPNFEGDIRCKWLDNPEGTYLLEASVQGKSIGAAKIDRQFGMTLLYAKDDRERILPGTYCQSSRDLDEEKKTAEEIIINNYKRRLNENAKSKSM